MKSFRRQKLDHSDLHTKRDMIGTMVAWESMRRTMRQEGDLAAKDAAAYHEAIHGDRGGDAVSDKESGQGHLVLGDYVGQIVQQQSPEKPKMSGLGKAAIGAASATGLGGLALAGMALMNAAKSEPAPAAPPAPAKQIPGKVESKTLDWKLGEPRVE